MVFSSKLSTQSLVKIVVSCWRICPSVCLVLLCFGVFLLFRLVYNWLEKNDGSSPQSEVDVSSNFEFGKQLKGN